MPLSTLTHDSYILRKGSRPEYEIIHHYHALESYEEKDPKQL